jgi:hypothetical protein
LKPQAKSNSRLPRNELESEQLHRDIHEGMDSGPAHPWSPAEMKRQGRKRLAARKAAE